MIVNGSNLKRENSLNSKYFWNDLESITKIYATKDTKQTFLDFFLEYGPQHLLKRTRNPPARSRPFLASEICDLYILFEQMDVDQNGSISLSELFKAIHAMNPKATLLDAVKIFKLLDVDESKSIDFIEFIRGIGTLPGRKKKKKIIKKKTCTPSSPTPIKSPKSPIKSPSKSPIRSRK